MRKSLFALLCASALFASTIDPAMNQNETIGKLRSNFFPIDGYFVHYGEGPFEWVYIVRETGSLYKLEGMNPETQHFIWTKLPYRKMGLELFFSGDMMFLGEQCTVPDVRQTLP